MTSASVNFTKIEEEVIYLKAVAEIIDAMINHEVLDLLGEDPHSEISFRSETHQKYFNILLVDFLSPSDKLVIKPPQSYLEAIRSICDNPNFGNTAAVMGLAQAAQDLDDWLEQEIHVEFGMSSIQSNADLSMKRAEFLEICGNISKHNFSRLGRTARMLRQILQRNDIHLDLHGTLLVLDEFYERFHSDLLNYHGSTIAEFLNNIRWGIHEYLQPVFSRSCVQYGGDPPAYEYTYPPGISNQFAKNCYWELMNQVRARPYVKRFIVTRFLKQRY